MGRKASCKLEIFPWGEEPDHVMSASRCRDLTVNFGGSQHHLHPLGNSHDRGI